MVPGFKNLIAWQKAYKLALAIYNETKAFPKAELYGLTQQLRRASVSVFANIAEGYERCYRKEYVRFLLIAKGSLGEVETYLMFARDLGFIVTDSYVKHELLRKEVACLLRGLIKSLNS